MGALSRLHTPLHAPAACGTALLCCLWSSSSTSTVWTDCIVENCECGGVQLIYLGPLGQESCQLVDYLMAQPGVSPPKPGHNPATWMLEVTGGAVSTSAKAAALDFAAVYQVRSWVIRPSRSVRTVLREIWALSHSLVSSGPEAPG